MKKVVRILKAAIPDAEVRSAMNRISFLIPTFHMSFYKKAIEDCISGGDAVDSISDARDDPTVEDILTQETTERYSKRAKLMLQGTQQRPSASRTDVSQLSQRSLIASPIRAARSMLDKVSNISMTVKSLDENKTSTSLTCSVCSSRAVVPCAGRCGHVCCEHCFSTWLKIKKTCPVCRQPTLPTDVSRIIVK